MKAKLFLFGLALALAGCKPHPAAPVSAATNQVFSVRGVIREIPPDHRHVTIQHEKIPGYMNAMTMPFSVKNTNELNGLSVGDEIVFWLVVTPDDDWVENFQRYGKMEETPKVSGWHLVERELALGETLPDYEFTDENGKMVRFADYLGKAVAFTFFFTSCPLPEYCPRMNRNFSEARKLLLNDTNAPANWQMLSISFDPGFDTPQVLAGYAKFYRGTDTNRWLFAVGSTNTLARLGPKVDLNFWRVDGVLSHNLRTIVLDPEGKIFKEFEGNDWTPKQLADAISKAAREK